MNRALAWMREWRAMPLIRTFVALAMFSMVTALPAHARWVTEVVAFKTADINRVGGFTAIDSLITTSGSGQHFDTTAALNTDAWELPISRFSNDADADSVDYAVLFFAPVPGGSVTVAADTVHVTVQVSANGQAWTTATPTANSDPAGYTLEQGTTNSFYLGLEQIVAGAATGGFIVPDLSSGTAPADNQIFGWPLMRFIVQGDHTGVYQAILRYWVED